MARTQGDEDPSPARLRILLADDNPDNLLLLCATLDDPDYELLLADSGEQALTIARQTRPDLALLDVCMPGIDGHETCRRLKADPALSDVPVLFLSAMDRIEARLASFAAGAVDFIAKPFDPEEVLVRVRTHLSIARLTRELSQRNRDLEREIEAAHAFRRERLAAMMAPLQGDGEVARRLRQELEAAAERPGPVLLRGSIADGTEAAARAIHESSKRCWRPFAKGHIHRSTPSERTLSTLSTSPTLAEQLLLAEGGTLYVESVGALPAAERAQLLALIEAEHVRVIAQHDPRTTGPLPPALAEALSASTVEVPPLSARCEDIPAIVAWIVDHEAPKLGKPAPALVDEDLARMLQYHWPGGIAEIESVIRRALLLSPTGQLKVTPDLGDEGRHLGRYRLQRLLGKGGMGEVWRARHELLPHPVAVKIIATELAEVDRRQAKDRFSREAVAIAQLQSPYTVRIHDFGASEDGELYYAMELLDGLDLHAMVHVDGPLPAARTIHLLRQAACSLAEAHARGLVHRDIKPPNLLVSRLGAECDWLKVVDFGIVTVEGDGADDRTLGTPGFFAPEIITGAGQPSPASDIYSLGCCAYWCLTAAAVFAGETTRQLLSAHATQAAPAPSDRAEIPAELDDLVLACLTKDPRARPTATELVDTLTDLARRWPWTRADAQSWWDERGGAIKELRDVDPRGQTSVLSSSTGPDSDTEVR